MVDGDVHITLNTRRVRTSEVGLIDSFVHSIIIIMLPLALRRRRGRDLRGFVRHGDPFGRLRQLGSPRRHRHGYHLHQHLVTREETAHCDIRVLGSFEQASVGLPHLGQHGHRRTKRKLLASRRRGAGRRRR